MSMYLSNPNLQPTGAELTEFLDPDPHPALPPPPPALPPDPAATPAVDPDDVL